MEYINHKKLENIKLTKENFYVVTDFDATITSSESASSWGLPEYYLPDEMKTKAADLVGKYYPIELDTTIDFKEKEKNMIEWYNKNIGLFYEYGLKKEMMEKAIEKINIIFRKGAKEFLKLMYEQKIPVIILSAGIGNAIELFLRKHKCYYENIVIVSNFIEFDENGKMKKFNTQNMIHTLNKSTKNKLSAEIADKLKDRKYKILLGDLIEDKNMVDSKEWNKTVLIGFLNKNIKENIETYCKNFDIVLTEENATFGEVINVLKIKGK